MRPMACGGGVGDGLTGVLTTSLTRLGAGGPSSLFSKDKMLSPPFRGSGARGGAAEAGLGVEARGVAGPYGSTRDPEDGLDCKAEIGRFEGAGI